MRFPYHPLVRGQMVRKLILTVGLSAFLKGEPPQLLLSVLAIFIFLLAHLLWKPYINNGLNVFQVIAP